ncbi:hypothetical protein LEP1GSC108_3284 [Leptospira weilii str. UI 13098]|uniref:Uncharacterized protein n=1 Tax=Leptospira weilii str. UI 13098 TaxID=1088542 RepID=M6QR57_9LEPT|nr:hypothetical protein LEP1GSC108_3284 [Leptospira weilii str. UI 13098]
MVLDMSVHERTENETLLLESRIEKIIDESIRHNPQDLISNLAEEFYKWSNELLTKKSA